VVDDYGHHPTEIRATLAAAMQSGRRLVVLFQPHRYSRTAALREEFARAFYDADVVLITDIYSAGEEAIEGGLHCSPKRSSGLVTGGILHWWH
jgi:UDP-N-acetylmuramate--alanine ligase